MGKLIAIAVIAACSKAKAPPPSPLQDGQVATVVDAATSIDAAPAKQAAITAQKLAVGAHAACAVMSDKTVRCWGDNAEGQLGNGSTLASAIPVTPNVRGVVELATGDDFTCALIDDTSVVCWGKIGFGKTHRTVAPTAAPGVRDVTKIFAVGGAACATEKSGPLVCWGDVDSRGRVTQTGNAHAPTPVPGIDHVVALTAHAALRDNNDVVLLGGAKVGSGVELAERDQPCALGADGVVTCFGDAPACATPKPAPKKPARKPTKKLKPKPEPPHRHPSSAGRS